MLICTSMHSQQRPTRMRASFASFVCTCKHDCTWPQSLQLCALTVHILLTSCLFLMHAWHTSAHQDFLRGITAIATCTNFVIHALLCVIAHTLCFLSLGIHGMPLAFSTAEQLCIPGAAYRAGKSVCQRSRVRLHNLPRSQQAAGLKRIVFCVNFVYFFNTDYGLQIP